jgi:hypothetical protein
VSAEEFRLLSGSHAGRLHGLSARWFTTPRAIHDPDYRKPSAVLVQGGRRFFVRAADLLAERQVVTRVRAVAG